ncbi:hypothetical protein ACF3MZ_15700 [Paenibacillaceae bacterium WGS1546]|uniref:hypothetical protein n=1 Tax=Cohnella sp. WGS1546 TaxID=3366810 RepID=UPI00372D3DE5
MKRLEMIAPVLALQWGKLDPLAELRFIGKLLHKEREVRDDGIYVWDRTARGAFNIYDALNLCPPELVRKRVLEQGLHST